MEPEEKKYQGVGADEEPKGRVRKTSRLHGELCCPVCLVTLWPETVEQHYHHEVTKLNSSVPHRRKRSSQSGSTQTEGKDKIKKLAHDTQQLLDSVKRRRILFQHPPAPSDAGPSGSSQSCPICGMSLSSDLSAARAHVNSCLGTQEDEDQGDSSGSETTYEEYTWCNETRVRATSMLTPEARANILGATVLTKTEGESEEFVDVEEDEMEAYGPAQYCDNGTCGMTNHQGGSKLKIQPVNCQICMDVYSNPLVSVQCWHVYCEECWLQALATKKVCPKCKQITSHSHLRKIFL